MGKKPANATVDDLAIVQDALGELRQQVRQLQEDARSHTDRETQRVTNDLGVHLKSTREQHDQNVKRIDGRLDDSEQRAQHIQVTAVSAKTQAEELGQEVKTLESQVIGFTKSLDECVKTLKADLEKGLEEISAKVKGQLQEERQAVLNQGELRLGEARRDLEAQLQKLRESGEAWRQESKKELKELQERGEQQLKEQEQRQQQALKEESKGLRQELGKVEQQLSSALSEKVSMLEGKLQAQDARRGQQIDVLSEDLAACKQQLAEQGEEIKDTAAKLEAAKKELEERLEEAETTNAAHFKMVDKDVYELKCICSEVGGFAAKQVEWVIPDALQRLRETKDEACEEAATWVSPKFCAGGARGLQLEMRVLPRDRAHEENPNDTSDCSVLLWGVEGLRLSGTLVVGNECIELRHAFDGKSPCLLPRVCSLAEQLNREDGSVKLVLEVHEASRDHVVSAGPLPAAAIEDKIEEVQEDEELLQPSQEENAWSGTMRVQSYLNLRLMELIQNQSRGLMEVVQKKVDLVRSRAVRRVQWRLEGAGMLRQYFPEGRAVCSTAFQAAGVNGMQLVFFPSGCAGAKEGFCSFFLSCPAGCALRCWLWAGRWRKEARPEPADRQDLLGRINFCRFENCIDPVDESVELAVEIEEVQQITKTHPSAESTAGALPSPIRGGKGADLDRVDISTLKLEPKPSVKTNPQHVKQLPSIWTTQGFHSFGEFKDVSKPGTARNTTASSEQPQQQQQQQHQHQLMPEASGDLRPQTTGARLQQLPQAPGASPKPPRSAQSLPSTMPKSARGPDRSNAATTMPAVPSKYRQYLPP